MNPFERRRQDWRFGQVVYQVFVDRFAPSDHLEDKRYHYSPPRQLRTWEELPARGRYNNEECVSSQEMDFWGGDLQSIRGKLDYLQELGVELLYLNPIFLAFSNHKYDATDYHQIDPQFGTLEDLRQLADDLHGRGMKLMLDGVFNHLGRRSPLFEEAFADPASPRRDWFTFGNKYPKGYLSWRNVANLPEWKLENQTVRDYLWESKDSVVQRYIREFGVDGWRLDVAPDIGFEYLRDLTDRAHEAAPHSSVIGECWNYPERWLTCLDGILNLHVRQIIHSFLEGHFSPESTARSLEYMVADGGLDGILRSHLVLDNHDVPRLAHTLPNPADQTIARILQFTLPGCPVIYYGTELGMEGGHDPANRAPMRWDLLNDANETYKLTRRLVEMRKELPALRIGEFRVLPADGLLAFLRTTDIATDTVAVIVNPSNETRQSLIPLRDSRLMDSGGMTCKLTGEHVTVASGSLDARIPPKTALVMVTQEERFHGAYTMFKRV